MKKTKLSVLLAIFAAVVIAVTSSFAANADDSVMKGDVNGDKKVSMEDVVLVQKYIAKLTEFDDSAVQAADVTNDNEIKMTDVTLIQKYIAKLIEDFPTGPISDDDIIIIIDDSDSSSESGSDSNSDSGSDSSSDSNSDSNSDSKEWEVDSEGWPNYVFKP